MSTPAALAVAGAVTSAIAATMRIRVVGLIAVLPCPCRAPRPARRSARTTSRTRAAPRPRPRRCLRSVRCRRRSPGGSLRGGSAGRSSPRTYGDCGALAVGTPTPIFFLERGGELAAAGDLELRVGAGQVLLHGLGRHEQRLGYLAVGHAAGRELGHSALAGRERRDAPGARAAGLCAGGAQ